MNKLNLLLILLILSLFIFLSGCLSSSENPEPPKNYSYENETTVYQGKNLTPISEQGNFAIKGTQKIDKESYRLQIEGNKTVPKLCNKFA
ncbi:hypothetical protein [Methanohalobium sp.]|uniref:hypothetical protein n=1 Tax=Methanohalobium sp. TaxID=2837493 RepID=UPI0025F41A3E|nr:hypothetical protein [Methanohalobium sp.]